MRRFRPQRPDKIDFATTDGSIDVSGKGNYTGTILYRKTTEGLVWAEGSLTRTSGNVTSGDYILNANNPLPAELMPAYSNVYLMAGAASFYCKVQLLATGAISVAGLITGSLNVTSTNIRFNAVWVV